jgi:hypothetical protein
MPITVADIRDELGDYQSIVSSSRIQSLINSWQQRVTLRAGSEYVESELGLEVVRMGATSGARRIFDLLNQREESPDARDMRIQAEALLKDLDEMTGTTDESGGIYEGLVSNVSDDPLWSAQDFGINQGSTW